jgi:hypothetical protein
LAAAISLTLLAGLSPSDIVAREYTNSMTAQSAAQGDSKWSSPRTKGVVLPAPTSAVARYTVVLKSDPVVTFLARQPSPPRIDSGRPASIGRIDLNSASALRYVQQLEAEQSASLTDFSNTVGRPLQAVLTMQHALNAVVLDLTPAEAAALGANPRVEHIERDRDLPLHTYAGPAFIGATSIWDGSATGIATQGEGLIVGIVDTGINFASPAFAGTGPIDGYVHANPLGEGNYLGTCAAGGPDVGLCTSKLIGAYNFTAPATANDTNGHGSHTASTAAGNTWNASFNGLPFTLSGVAPHANVIAYKACPTDTCPTSATTASVNQAIINGVDAINFSIGGGTSPWLDTPSVAFRNAVAAGIFVATSAGNDGEATGTAEHLEPWTETVAASTHDQSIAALFDLTSGTPSAATQDIIVLPGATPWPATPQVNRPLIKSPGFANGTNDGCAAFPADTFARILGNADVIFNDSFEEVPEPPMGRIGGIAVLSLDGDASACGSGVRRGNALAAGAVGVIFVDNEYLNLGASGTTWSMLQSDWDAVEAEMDGTTDTASISIAQGVPAQGDTLAQFSSRGPSPLANEQVLIKPEISAPGVDILATSSGNSGTGGSGSTETISGTSMASPHIAGASLLLRALNPAWTPMQVKSALNLTAVDDDLIDFDDSVPGVFAIGSGRADLRRAANAGLVMDETIANFIDANPALPTGDVSKLNLAQFAHGKCIGDCSFTRSFRRARSGAQTYNVSVSGLPAGSFTIAPAQFTISTSGTRSITLSVEGDELPEGAWAYGEVTLTPVSGTEPELKLPIAINAYGPIIEVDPTSISVTGSQTVDLDITNVGNPTLNWQVEANSIDISLLDSSFLTSGQLGGYYTPLSEGWYWFQNFDVGQGGSDISRLQANGFVLPGSSALTAANTTAVTFAIYDESNTTPGQPAGAPEGFGAPARWTYTNAINTGGIQIIEGESIAVDFTDPAVPALNLPEGRYWMTAWPTMNSTHAQTAANPLWAWFTSPDPQIGNPPLLYLPSDDPSQFQSDADTFLMSGIIQGTQDCTLPAWVQVAPTSGSAGINETDTVAVTFDSTGLPAGTYTAQLCITSNAANEPQLAVPLSFTVAATPFVSMAFSPGTVQSGAADPATLTITLNNPTAVIATLTSDLVDTFPAGLTRAATPSASTTCTSGSVSSTATSVTLASGAQIPAGGSCTVSIDVDAAVAGTYVDDIPADELQTSAGNNATAASASLTVTAPQVCSGQLLLDPSFEESGAGTSTAWDSTSTAGGTSLCDAATCGADLARTGAWYAWFGGWGVDPEVGTATQNVVIPSGPSRSIRFWMLQTETLATNTSMTLSIDGDVLATYPSASVSDSDYEQYEVVVPAQYADGGSHEIEFFYSTPGDADMGDMFVDDVTLECTQAPPSVTKAFAGDIVDAGTDTTLTIELSHALAGVPTLTAPLVDTLPAGMQVSPVPAASTTCPNGSVTADAGSGSISLAAGAQIPAAGCTVTADVRVTGSGTLTNTIAAGALQTNFGVSGEAATASLRGLAATQDDQFGFEAPFTLGALNNQQGWAAANVTVSNTTPSSGTQHLRMVSGAARPQAFSPSLDTGAGRYASVAAMLNISKVTNGANWQFQPQDATGGFLSGQVIFDRVAQTIQVRDFSGAVSVLVPTGATYTADTYFEFEMVFDRQLGSLELCKDGVSIYNNTAAYVSGYVDEVFLSMQSGGNGTTGNTQFVDDLRVTTGNTGGCGALRPSGPAATLSTPIVRRHTQAADARATVRHGVLRRQAVN